MEVTSTKDGNSARVVVVGDIDSETSAQLETTITSLLAKGIRDLSLDLTDVTFLSSAGLSVLITAHRGAENFRLEPGNRIVDRLIELTGLSLLYGPQEEPSSD